MRASSASSSPLTRSAAGRSARPDRRRARAFPRADRARARRGPLALMPGSVAVAVPDLEAVLQTHPPHPVADPLLLAELFRERDAARGVEGQLAHAAVNH